MRLIDLSPKFWAAAGRRGQGMIFLCPHCRKTVLCIAFANPLDGGPPWDIGTEQRRPIPQLFDILYGEGLVERGVPVCPPGYLWTRTGEDFGSMTLSPSVDASRAGCWHGFVAAGEIR